MCGYSLEHVKNRKAVVNDMLVATRFPRHASVGFAEVGKPGIAVCLLPGTELVVEQKIERSGPFSLIRDYFWPHYATPRTARFREIDVGNGVRHDALEFSNGEIVKLHQLTPGGRAQVLQLPATAKLPPERNASSEASSRKLESV